ncbi:hypothetical protein PIB30_049931 [Stylosanthes scabra]|uniref:Uncharacterized protein n=1 Tax=Stylosanthes scabra TaxID=79078 RepID=A0ABU6RHH7_9FABA|nr:hypothetical protein [Stylosanthes scabra]
MARKEPSLLAKGKAKIQQLPTRFSLRFAALRARQPTEKAGPSNTAPAIPDPIIISSDSEEEDLEMDPEGEDPEIDSDLEDEEIAEVANFQQGDNEYDEYFSDYFELAPPPSPDSSDESLPPTDD